MEKKLRVQVTAADPVTVERLEVGRLIECVCAIVRIVVVVLATGKLLHTLKGFLQRLVNIFVSGFVGVRNVKLYFLKLLHPCIQGHPRLLFYIRSGFAA